MKKSGVINSSRKNVNAKKQKKNYLLNIVLIILFVFVVLFIVKLVFVKDVAKSPDDEGPEGTWRLYDHLPFLVRRFLWHVGLQPQQGPYPCSNTETEDDILNVCDQDEVCIEGIVGCSNENPFQTTCQECGSNSDCPVGKTCSGCSCS